MPSFSKPPVVSAEQAAALVKSGDWVDWGLNGSQPVVFDRALAARASELRGVKIRSGLALRPRAVLEADPRGEHFHMLGWHFSGADRKAHDAGIMHYIPMNFGEAPAYYRRFIERVDVACLQTAPMDEHGYFNFSAAVTYLKAVTERATKLVVEVNPSYPRVLGCEEGVHASEVDFVIEGDGQPTPVLPAAPPTEVDKIVARLIAAEIEDGSCLQIGIGGMPNAVCSMLKDAGVKELGVHTEMLVDGMVELYEAGLITGARKQLNRGQMVFTFALGSPRLYEFIDRNPGAQSYPVDYTNLPDNIARNERVVSINNTTQLDLQGQAASESSGHRHISGTGGQLQFVRGAYQSLRGKSFICLSSVYERNGKRESRIVTTLTPGNIVTTPRTDTMYVVTEYGMVNLKGLSVPERASALIGIAHPDFREALGREARERNLIPRVWS
ncbi:MAG TPA: acetyl-CoA hydrolase/transferase C-terminal domain-containing protein [Myxococcota bacterium]